MTKPVDDKFYVQNLYYYLYTINLGAVKLEWQQFCILQLQKQLSEMTAGCTFLFFYLLIERQIEPDRSSFKQSNYLFDKRLNYEDWEIRHPRTIVQKCIRMRLPRQ